jgi:site-specific recombinase XerD
MHTYRHTYASNLCRFGVPIQTASALLGHDSIETTARFYVNVAEESKKEAALKLRQVMEA